MLLACVPDGHTALCGWSCPSSEMRTLSPRPGPAPAPALAKHACASPPEAPFLPPSGPVGSRWRDYSALAIIMAGIAFGFHQLYKVSPPSPRAPCAAPASPLRSCPAPWQGQAVCRGRPS